MLKKLRRIFDFIFSFYLNYEIFYANLPTRTTKTRTELADKFIIEENSTTLDIGCGRNKRNIFRSSNVIGLDVFEDKQNNVHKCILGMEAIDFQDNTFDFITAFDLLEHIPRHAYIGGIIINPFINLMNEVWRVLKPGGIFLSSTPIYPFSEVFVDPTHCNIMTSETLESYFSDKRDVVSKDYGIKTDFKIIEQHICHRHLVVFMSK